MKLSSTEKSRHLVVRADAGERLPEVLLDACQDQVVLGGFLRAAGVVTDVEIRALGGGQSGGTRRIVGRVQLLSLEGSIGMLRGEVSIGMRALLARETERGIETIVGELIAAKIVALEGLITALDDVALSRALDAPSGAVMLEGSSAGAAPPPAQPSAPAVVAAAPSAPALTPVEPAPAVVQRPSNPPTTMPMPLRPVRAKTDDVDAIFPEAGDHVQHFAFGRCEVVKSDGDRLHLRVGKDGKIREIALEMLKVQLIPSEGDTRLFRLDRRL
jgi:predicted DNA-binding protein with PD1-like motif